MDGRCRRSDGAGLDRTGEGLPDARRWGLVLALILVVYAISASAAVATRAVMANEAFFASPALTLLRKGYLGTTIIEGRGTWMEGIEWYTY